MLNIIQNRKTYFTISSILVALSIASLLIWGLVPAIDFTGGTLMEIEFNTEPIPNIQEIRNLFIVNKDTQVSKEELGEVRVQPIGEKGMLFRFKPISEDTHQEILTLLHENFNPDYPTTTATTTPNVILPIEELKYESIGPVIGQELQKKTTWAIAMVAVCIILYIAWAFRKVSKPVQSWKYGIGAIVALGHDIIIVAGIFSVLGRFAGVEIDVLFVTALLTILGYSVNDTIVVYDRTRENLHRYQGFDFEDIVNRSVNETIVRSLNTSITTLLVLFSVYLFGGASIRNFVLALICGAFVGTYSSIFIASPLLVVWQKLRRR
ncbi:protein translocase subunit SecF [Patescibacteria group bacterium]|nr:protein translocase subunit SecF [Patescibacteria group bacterium]MBU4512544.1 protein translocase subunit SecF [Patescibacteria group bacterium]MCG2693070.1 protein translocase subunit SecF [Candidatus Parcubacteria bacterium]